MTDVDDESSHFNRFLSIYNEMKDLLKKTNNSWSPSRDIPTNPIILEDRSADDGSPEEEIPAEIQNNSITPKSLTITFYNVLGETLMTKTLYNKYNLLDLSEFKDSIYLYKLISENGAVKSGKIIKD